MNRSESEQCGSYVANKLKQLFNQVSGSLRNLRKSVRISKIFAMGEVTEVQ